MGRLPLLLALMLLSMSCSGSRGATQPASPTTVPTRIAPTPALPGATAAPSAPATSAQSPQKSPPLRVETVASGLEVVWSLAFAPDGRLFFTERPGRIRVMVDGKVLPDPVAELPAASSSESGLMGLALDPGFSGNGYIYVDYTYRTIDDRMVNRVSRMTVQGNRAGDEKVLLDGIP
ncbi:MAG TPA: PQQ-dependent sugar dehydrogenase, partial [Chloroflexota bacterium]